MQLREKKKIVVLVDWFTPGFKAGGPIQSAVNFANALRKEYKIFIITTDTDLGSDEPYPDVQSDVRTKDNRFGLDCIYLKKKSLNSTRIKEELGKADADFVYLNHLFSPLFVLYPIWLKMTGKINGAVVLCPRGALFPSALAVKSWKKFPTLRLMRWLNIQRFLRFHATNLLEADAIRKYFPKAQITVADNFPNSNQPLFASVKKNPGSLKCIFISRIVPIKNLLYLLEVLENVRTSVDLTVIGPTENPEYLQRCLRQVEKLDASKRVQFLGSVRNEDLAVYLQKHHLFILPTEGENFGHAIFESLLSGRPVLISNQTPWRNLEVKNIGWDIELSEKKKYAERIEAAAAWDQQTFDKWALSTWNFAHDYLSDTSRFKGYKELFV